MSLAVAIERIGGAIPEVGNATSRWARREGLLLRLVDADGRSGVGEASPLPGHSPDDLEQAFAALEHVVRSDARGLFESASSLEALGAFLDAHEVSSPSARFALETAALDLRGQREGRPLHRLLSEATSARVPLSTLVPLSGARATARAASALVDAGYRSFKPKIGGDRAMERESLRALRETIGEGGELRLDANASLSRDEAESRLAELADLGPSYVEEPTALHALEGVPRGFAVDVALDESLLHLDTGALERFLAAGKVGAVVLKPMLLGGFGRCLAIAELAARVGIGAAASHLFDGSVALAAASELALALPRPLAAGLAPHAALPAYGALPLASHRGASIVAHDRPGLGFEAGVA